MTATRTVLALATAMLSCTAATANRAAPTYRSPTPTSSGPTPRLVWPPPPAVDRRVVVDGEVDRGIALVASPNAVARGFNLGPAGTLGAIALPATVGAFRYEELVVVGTEPEVRVAWDVIGAARARFADRSFVWFGDIGMYGGTLANRAFVAELGRDAGLELEASQEPWVVACLSCRAALVVSALVALGAAVR